MFRFGKLGALFSSIGIAFMDVRALSERLVIGKSRPEDAARVLRLNLAVKYQSFGFFLLVWFLPIGEMVFSCVQRCLSQSILSPIVYEGGSCDHNLSFSADRNPTAFASKHSSSPVSSMRALINCTLGRTNRKDTRARLVNAFIKNVFWIQGLFLQPYISSSPPLSAILGSPC